MSGLTLALVIASCGLATAGQLLLRSGAAGHSDLLNFVNPLLVAGLAAYTASTVCWIAALARAPLVAVYPFTLLTFVLVGASAVIILGERVNGVVLTGWAVIVAGLALVWFGSAAQ